MPTKARMSKVPEYPRPHNMTGSWAHGIESAVVNDTTILPLITYDEGLGVINSYKSNPQNASFVEVNTDHCYPTSTINKIFCEVQFQLSKEALETDKVHVASFATMMIHTSFMDGQLAEDEVSGLDLNEILKLQNEATDRQTYPLFNNVGMKTFKSNATLDLPAETPGLTTDLEIEGVAFNNAIYYNALAYLTNGNKLKSISDGLRWHHLTKDRPSMTLRFHQNSQTKFMNPYTFLGLMISVPQNSSPHQWGKPGDTSDVNHIEVSYRYRYNEWNHEFNHSLQ